MGKPENPWFASPAWLWSPDLKLTGQQPREFLWEGAVGGLPRPAILRDRQQRAASTTDEL